MRNQIILLLLIFASSISIAQNTDSKFTLKSSFAFGGTDDRIFGRNESSTARFKQMNSEKILPSMYFDVGLEYELLEIGKLNIGVGLKYGFEWNNSFRPYNHCLVFKLRPCPYVLVTVDGYSYHLIGTSFTLEYGIYKTKKGLIKIGAGISPNLRFLGYYDDGKRPWDKVWSLEYLFTEVTPQISIVRPNYEIGLYTRVWQHRKVDRVIYPARSTSAREVVPEDYFNINPWKVGVFVKYDLPFRKKDKDVEVK